MAPKDAKLVVEKDEEEMAADDDDEPVSPTGQYFNSSVLSVAILAIFESEIAIDDSPTISTLEKLFLPINPRFSSIMARDKKGNQRWQKVKVKVEDHVRVPIFPTGLSESYDQLVLNYLSKIAREQLPQNRPLWELHIIKYPTRNAAGTIVFKLHHALGDGFSLMGALFSCIQRADDPSLPLTFPNTHAKHADNSGKCGIVPRAFSVCTNTIRDFGWSLLKSKLVEDDRSSVRSGDAGVELRPVVISTVAFSLDDIRKIKNKLEGTVNDVVSGIVFYGTHLYMKAGAGEGKKAKQVTALVLLNTRVVSNYQDLKEMNKRGAKSSWGNQFGFMHVSIPKCKDAEKVDPLYFVLEAKRIIKRKRSSLAVYLTGWLLEMIRKLRGPEATAHYIYSTLKNTSMSISNLTGPMEQMIMAGHPIRTLSFMVVGSPQSLTITVVSYMGKLNVAMGAEKDFIDSQLLISCMESAFERIYEAALGKRGSNNIGPSI